jgi:hypothetical protein
VHNKTDALIHTHTYRHSDTYTHTHSHTHTLTHIHTYRHIHTLIDTSICKNTQLLTHTHTHAHTHVPYCRCVLDKHSVTKLIKPSAARDFRINTVRK